MNHVFKRTLLITLLLISSGIAAMETIQEETDPVNLAILISGEGTNMDAILEAIKNDENIVPKVVISNHKDAGGIEKAKERGVHAEYVPKMKAESREAYGQKLITTLEQCGLTSKTRNLICLAGFMVLLDKNIVQKYKDCILNIHPAHPIENYPGANAIEKAFEAGETEMGATVHFVDEGMDTGAVVMHKSFNVEPTDKLEDVEAKMHKVEHQIFPDCVRLFAQKRLCIYEGSEGREVHILPPDEQDSDPYSD